MNIQEQIRNIYPNAVLIKDCHNYGKLEINLNYIVLHDVIPSENISSKINDEIILDFMQIRNKTEIHPLSTWQSTSEEAWQEAWRLIQSKMESKLAS